MCVTPRENSKSSMYYVLQFLKEDLPKVRQSPCGKKVVSGPGDQVTTETKDGTPVLHGHVPRESICFLVLIDMGTLGMGGLLPGLKGQTWVLRLGGRFLYQLCPQPAFIPSSETARLSVCLLSALSSS